LHIFLTAFFSIYASWKPPKSFKTAAGTPPRRAVKLYKPAGMLQAYYHQEA